MPENGQIPDTEAESSTAPSVDTLPVEETAVRKRKRSMFRDPVVRTMAWVAAGLVALYLAGVASALIFGIIGNDAPRTRAEQALFAAEARVQAGEADVETIASFAAALIDVGQYSRAQRVIDEGLETVDQSRGAELTVEQARLHLGRQDFDAAVTTADEAQEIINATYEQELAGSGASQSSAYGRPDSYYLSLLIEAEAYTSLGDSESAIAAYDEYLDELTTASNIYVKRGELKLEVGDAAGAEEDFNAALRFVPDDEAALAGLEKIGADQ